MAERKWCKSNDPSDQSRYQSLLSSFSAKVHTAKSSHIHNKINSAPDISNLFRTFNSLLCPPPSPPTTSITADDFATFFTGKSRTISSQFYPPHTHTGPPTNHIHSSNSHLLLLSPSATLALYLATFRPFWVILFHNRYIMTTLANFLKRL